MMGTRRCQHRHAAHLPPTLMQYFVQLFPLVEEHVRRSMGEKLYELFLVSVPNPPDGEGMEPPPHHPSPVTPAQRLGLVDRCKRVF